jgi:hypothetical protein
VAWSDGKQKELSRDELSKVIEEELSKVYKQIGKKAYDESKFKLASKLFADMCTSSSPPEFLTSYAYPFIIDPRCAWLSRARAALWSASRELTYACVCLRACAPSRQPDAPHGRGWAADERAGGEQLLARGRGRQALVAG